METFNRYIDGGSKRDQMSDLRGIENSSAEYGLVQHGRIAGDTPAGSTRLRLSYGAASTKSLMHRKPLMIARSDGRTPERQPTNRTGQLQSALAMCGSEIAQCRKGHCGA